MMSMAQAYSPHPTGLQQHPGMAQGHPMGPGHPHNPQQAGGQQGPGMPQQMHMGVSGPGVPQVTQAGALLGVMPPGVSGPGGPNAHALQHLNPNQQAQMYQQQQQAQMGFANPQMQHMAQQQMLQVQQQRQAAAARQAMMAQQYQSGMPMNLPNGMNPGMNAAQFAAMRGAANMRPVPLPQHLQQQQQQAQLGLEQQQAQQAQQQQHQQQQMIAQQMAMQQANAAAHAGNNQGPANAMGPQQLQNLQNAQMAAAQHQQQQAQQQQQVQQQAQQQQPQPQPQQAGAQQPQAQGQPQPQQAQQAPPQQPPNAAQQQQVAAATAAAMMHRPRPPSIKGQCILRLMQFGDHLSQFVATKQQTDLNYWTKFVELFFSVSGVLRHSVWIIDENSNKQYEITFPALARYFYTHFESGVKNIQMIFEKYAEREMPNGTFIESQKASFIYWFENGSQLVAHGALRVQFDTAQMIELLEFVTTNHEEFLPRSRVVEGARPLHEWQKEWQKVNNPPDGKQSPEMNKKGKAKLMKSPATAPPEIDIPESKVKLNMGITPSVFRFLELAEVLGQMNPLFHFSHLNSSLAPYAALDQYVNAVSQVPMAPNPNGQMMASGQRTPSMGQFPMGQSPAVANMALPDAGAIQGSPAQGNMQAPGMAMQASQQGTSSSGPSANTSPNVSNKRRRPSVKPEEEGAGNQPNGVQSKVKPSPRIGGKRQKGNPA